MHFIREVLGLRECYLDIREIRLYLRTSQPEYEECFQGSPDDGIQYTIVTADNPDQAILADMLGFENATVVMLIGQQPTDGWWQLWAQKLLHLIPLRTGRGTKEDYIYWGNHNCQRGIWLERYSPRAYQTPPEQLQPLRPLRSSLPEQVIVQNHDDGVPTYVQAVATMDIPTAPMAAPAADEPSNQNQSVVLVIDGANLWYSLPKKSPRPGVRLRINYRKLRDILVNGRRLVASYYVGRLPAYYNPSQAKRLRRAGFRLILPTAPIPTGVPWDDRVIRDHLVEWSAGADTVILVSGDKHMLGAIQAVRHLGKTVEIANLTLTASGKLLQLGTFIDLLPHLASFYQPAPIRPSDSQRPVRLSFHFSCYTEVGDLQGTIAGINTFLTEHAQPYHSPHHVLKIWSGDVNL